MMNYNWYICLCIRLYNVAAQLQSSCMHHIWLLIRVSMVSLNSALPYAGPNECCGVFLKASSLKVCMTEEDEMYVQI